MAGRYTPWVWQNLSCSLCSDEVFPPLQTWQPYSITGRKTVLYIRSMVLTSRIFDKRLSILTRWAYFERMTLIWSFQISVWFSRMPRCLCWLSNGIIWALNFIRNCDGPVFHLELATNKCSLFPALKSMPKCSSQDFAALKSMFNSFAEVSKLGRS